MLWNDRHWQWWPAISPTHPFRQLGHPEHGKHRCGMTTPSTIGPNTNNNKKSLCIKINFTIIALYCCMYYSWIYIMTCMELWARPIIIIIIIIIILFFGWSQLAQNLFTCFSCSLSLTLCFSIFGRCISTAHFCCLGNSCERSLNAKCYGFECCAFDCQSRRGIFFIHRCCCRGGNGVGKSWFNAARWDMYEYWIYARVEYVVWVELLSDPCRDSSSGCSFLVVLSSFIRTLLTTLWTFNIHQLYGYQFFVTICATSLHIPDDTTYKRYVVSDIFSNSKKCCIETKEKRKKVAVLK